MQTPYTPFALQVLDAIATVLCLRTGQARKANPLLAKLFDAIGMVSTLTVLKGTCLVYLHVICSNVRVLRKLKASA